MDKRDWAATIAKQCNCGAFAQAMLHDRIMEAIDSCVAQEREACARLVTDMGWTQNTADTTPISNIAAAIRNRGATK